MSKSKLSSYEKAYNLPPKDVIQAAIDIGCPVYLDMTENVSEEAMDIIDFLQNQIYRGYLVELEHGTKWGKDSPANLTNDDTRMTVRIAWAHILEDPVYYSRLNEMENQSEGFLGLLKTGVLCDYNKLIKKVNEHLEPHRANEVKKPPSITLDDVIANQKFSGPPKSVTQRITLDQF